MWKHSYLSGLGLSLDVLTDCHMWKAIAERYPFICTCEMAAYAFDVFLASYWVDKLLAWISSFVCYLITSVRLFVYSGEPNTLIEITARRTKSRRLVIAERRIILFVLYRAWQILYQSVLYRFPLRFLSIKRVWWPLLHIGHVATNWVFIHRLPEYS